MQGTTSSTIRATTLLVVLTLTASSCALNHVDASDLDATVHSWGTLREALRNGDTRARVHVGDLAKEGVFAVGAADGLAGEITIFDGRVWHSSVFGDQSVKTERSSAMDLNATILFASKVERWKVIRIKRNVSSSVFEEFLAQTARASGLDTKVPFAFIIEGELEDLEAHIVAGECPIRARMLKKAISSPPYEIRHKRVEARLVGIYAENAERQITHAGSRTHLHVLLETDVAMTGHVESVAIREGCRLLLPVR